MIPRVPNFWNFPIQHVSIPIIYRISWQLSLYRKIPFGSMTSWFGFSLETILTTLTTRGPVARNNLSNGSTRLYCGVLHRNENVALLDTSTVILDIAINQCRLSLHGLL